MLFELQIVVFQIANFHFFCRIRICINNERTLVRSSSLVLGYNVLHGGVIHSCLSLCRVELVLVPPLLTLTYRSAVLYSVQLGRGKGEDIPCGIT